MSCFNTDPLGKSFLMAFLRELKSGLSVGFSFQQLTMIPSSSSTPSAESMWGLSGLQPAALTLSTISEKQTRRDSPTVLYSCPSEMFFSYVMKSGFKERGSEVHYHTSSTEVTIGDVERPSTIYYLLSDNGKTVDVPFLSTISWNGLPQQLWCPP